MTLLRFFSSTIGKKFLVATTGLFMVFFLLLHLAGNLEIFAGPEPINQYSEFLRSMPKLLWTFRIALLASVIIHIWATISLSNTNRNARPQKYHLKRSRKASFVSRTMMVSGITVLVFIAYHLAHYTLGITNPELMKLMDDKGRHHVYNMMVMGFSHPLVSSFYVAAQILLACHLSHGVSSAARTFGVIDRAIYGRIRILGITFATLIALLYISIPCSVLLGLIPLDY